MHQYFFFFFFIANFVQHIHAYIHIFIFIFPLSMSIVFFPFFWNNATWQNAPDYKSLKVFHINVYTLEHRHFEPQSGGLEDDYPFPSGDSYSFNFCEFLRVWSCKIIHCQPQPVLSPPTHWFQTVQQPWMYGWQTYPPNVRTIPPQKRHLIKGEDTHGPGG